MTKRNLAAWFGLEKEREKAKHGYFRASVLPSSVLPFRMATETARNQIKLTIPLLGQIKSSSMGSKITMAAYAAL